jgi:5'-deoxynucleotidase YfbR-like HD superfamily hydrolase
MRLTDCLHLSIVPRWSVVPVLRQQSVAEHAYRVAVIALEIADKMNKKGVPVDPNWVIRWAIFHDGEECYTADIPTPFKKSLNAKIPMSIWQWIREELARVYGRLEHDIVKAADGMEAIDFLTRWGNGPEAKLVALHILDRMTQISVKIQNKYGKMATEALAEVGKEMCESNSPQWMKDMIKEE